jgi:hypothetical protein
MLRIDRVRISAILLTLALAGPPLWWAGEALAAARPPAPGRDILTPAVSPP